MILNYISLPVFIVSFAIGLFFVYILGPDMKSVYIYPSPENINKILFKDKTDACFRFNSIETKCPKNSSEIMNIPIQA